jgi:hypothetical protein
MSKKAFEKIAEGLTDAIAIAKGEADPASYQVHAPADRIIRRPRRGFATSSRPDGNSRSRGGR